MNDQDISEHLANAARAFGVSVEAMGETFKVTNRQFVLSQKDSEKISENMAKSANAGETLRHNIIASNMVPEGTVIHYPKEDLISAIMPAMMPIKKPFDDEFGQFKNIQLKSTIGPPKDWSKVFQFRKHRKPRYLRRFKCQK